MRPTSTKTFYFESDAHSLGGFISHPSQKMIPSQAHSSLPAVGGHVMTSTGAFSHDSIVSCRSAYTRITGREHDTDGPWSMVVTSVVEGLNIMEVLTAERIVAQVSVVYTNGKKHPEVSFAGSHFDGVRLGNHDLNPTMNPTLHKGGGSLSHEQFQKISRTQGKAIVGCAKGSSAKWVHDRFGWMDTDPKPGDDRSVLCSLVNDVSHDIPGTPYCHAVEIPHFGRIFFGEFSSRPGSIRLAMVRAELGCNVQGKISASVVGPGGGGFPP